MNTTNNNKNTNGSKPKKPHKLYEFKFKLSFKNFFVAIFIAFVVFSLIISYSETIDNTDQKPLGDVIVDVRDGKVAKLIVEDSKVTAEYKDQTKVEAQKEPQDSIYTMFEAARVDPKLVTIEIKDTSGSAAFWSLVANLLPVLLLLGVFVFFFRQARGAQDNIFSFGQSKARLFNKDNPRVTFKDVAGVNEAKAELEEVVDFLKHPGKYRALGARTPKGVLLVGPSGTGKTLLARAVAGEAGVPFFSMAGSEFMEMLVGVGASRVRDLFSTAKKNSPAIIFIDEIDAIGRMRSVGVMGGHDEREQTLNQILVEMDGFEPSTALLVVAATNRGDLLDPALLRPGRFDRRISLDLPDIEGRKNILAIHARGKPFSKEVSWDKAAKRTVGFSGADLENMLNEAAILAARHNKKEISMHDLEEAATKVKLGPEKKRLQTDLDKKMTAYHEAGHAVVTHELPHMDPVYRISIVSRGMALGFNLIVPSKDRLHLTKSQILEQITSMLGGRAAEEVVFDEFTSGASNDIDKATELARDMVLEYGMSSLGPVNLGPHIDYTDSGNAYMEKATLSPEMLARVDREIEKILDTAYKQAVAIIKKLRKNLDKVAAELITKETIEGEDFEKLMGFPKKAYIPASSKK
ncbi:ATP-dependent zinc metalloprotease FtsH [Candidatus Gottesmanbacteria bacterium]|nr:ATP-dependent zinc metalloprotease FtsH [Candidatus Gottesmanbacteria bacterium]